MKNSKHARLSILTIFFLPLAFFWTGTKLPAQISFGSLTDRPTSKEEKGKDNSANKTGKEGEEDADVGPLGSTLGTPVVKKYRFGMELEARPGGECSDVFASIPVPYNWPEQQVRVIEENFPQTGRVDYRDLREGGCREMIYRTRQLKAGQKMEISVTLEVIRLPQTPPKETDAYRIPKRLPRELKQYLKESPFIEINERRIKKLAKEMDAEEESAWKKVERVFQEIRSNVRYKEALKEKPVRGAMAALETGEGDCEDMSALFIAICRDLDIPARTVRVPDHCWAEFYLEDKKGNGYWFPAQVAGNVPLGVSEDTRPILQKGDAFVLPESPRETTRYVKELFTGQVKESGRDPKYQFIREEAGR